MVRRELLLSSVNTLPFSSVAILGPYHGSRVDRSDRSIQPDHSYGSMSPSHGHTHSHPRPPLSCLRGSFHSPVVPFLPPHPCHPVPQSLLCHSPSPLGRASPLLVYLTATLRDNDHQPIPPRRPVHQLHSKNTSRRTKSQKQCLS